MNFRNRTPHDVVLRDADNGVVAVFPPAGPPLRLTSAAFDLRTYDSIPIVRAEFSEFVPDPEDAPIIPGTYYIVSLVTALASPLRTDFLVPYDEVRDEQGTIIGCRSLARVTALR